MGNLDRKSLLLLTGGCAVAAFGVWLGSIAGGFWALALVGLSVCGVVALGLRGLLRRLSGQTLMVDGILLVGILACLSLEQSALAVNMVFAAFAVFLCADVAAWFRQWRGSLSDGAVADAGRGVVATFVAQLVLGVALLVGVGVVAFASGVGPWRWPLAVVLSLLCVCLLAVVVRPRSAGGAASGANSAWALSSTWRSWPSRFMPSVAQTFSRGIGSHSGLRLSMCCSLPPT